MPNARHRDNARRGDWLPAVAGNVAGPTTILCCCTDTWYMYTCARMSCFTHSPARLYLPPPFIPARYRCSACCPACSAFHLYVWTQTKSGAAITSFRLSGLCLLTTSLFDESVLMTRFLEPLPTGRPRADQTKKATRQNSCWCCGGRVTDGAAPLL